MTFQGLDLSDEGFNAVFYRNIYSNPESVQYSFMFWLTGVVGGAFDYLFPSLGLLGLRILGAITLTCTCLLSYRLLRPYLNKGALRLGLLFTLLVISNNIRIFHYNYLCMLLYMLCALFLLRGLTRNKPWLIFLAGVMVALETLARIPSIVNLGLALAIFYYGILYNYSFARQFRLALIYGAGFIGGLAAMIVFMKITNQYDNYIGAVKLVMEMGSGGASSHYGLSKLLKQFFVLYGSSVKHGLLIVLPVISAAMICNLVTYRPAYRKPLIQLLTLGIIAAFVWLIWTDTINHLMMVFLLTDLATLGALCIFVSEKNKELKVLALMGVYIILTYPLGSSDGIYTVGLYTLWIGVPIAVDYFNKWLRLDSQWNIQSRSENMRFSLLLKPEQLRTIGQVGTLLIFLALLRQAYYYPFFDWNDRVRMTAQVNNTYTRGVFTTKERATAINELLAESGKYIHPGDAVLIYHSVPLLHYMTNTRPYLRNAMPWLYEGSFFANELNT
ncbi:MAG: glycosyltransferase family 39 protein, partial [Chitinophagaceae bacterium]|nr:glycosyltransferase family 39 protein [Chitinophagaceae bacterium]